MANSATTSTQIQDCELTYTISTLAMNFRSVGRGWSSRSPMTQGNSKISERNPGEDAVLMV